MADIADIQVAIWSNPDFEALSNDAALLYVWSFSNPLINPAGIYRVSRSKLLDGRLDADALRRTLDELREAEFLMYSTDSWLWVRSHVRNFRSPSPRTLTSIEQTLLKVGRHEITAAFIAEYKARPVVKMPGLGATLNKLVAQGLAEGLQRVTKGSAPHSQAEFPTPSGPSVEGQGQGQGQGPGQGQGLEDSRAHASDLAAGVAAGVHPSSLPEVVAIFAEVKVKHPALEIEEAALSSAIRSKASDPDCDPVAGAHAAAAMVHAGDARRLVASVLLLAALDRQQANALRARQGGRPAPGSSGKPAPVVDFSKYDKRAANG